MTVKKGILTGIFIAIVLLILSGYFLISNEEVKVRDKSETWNEEIRANLCISDSECELRTVYSCCARGEVTWCVHVNDILKSEENCAPDIICPAFISPDDSSCSCSQNNLCRPN